MAQTYAKYQYFDDAGKKHPIRMSVADAAAQTTTATQGSYDSPISAITSLNRKKLGLRPRHLLLSRTVTGGTGGGAVTKTLYDRISILLKADFDAFVVGATITINGVTWTITGKEGERQA